MVLNLFQIPHYRRLPIHYMKVHKLNLVILTNISYINIRIVPRRQQSVKSSWRLSGESCVGDYWKNHAGHVIALRGENMEFLTLHLAGHTQKQHALKSCTQY